METYFRVNLVFGLMGIQALDLLSVRRQPELLITDQLGHWKLILKTNEASATFVFVTHLKTLV